MSQRAFTAFARLRDPALAEWITGHVRFPNCMVDRITPQTTETDRAELSRRFGIDDQWPVLCEPFTQWVLEENFADGCYRHWKTWASRSFPTWNPTS